MLGEGRSEAYGALVTTRKACHSCQGVVNPSACAEGIYDSDHIGPWSLWQGSLNAELVIVGQDWGDTGYFTANRGHESARNPTNETLIKLLRSVEIEIPAPSPHDAGSGPLFFTNAVLCLKNGGMQAKVQPEWFASCGGRFLKPTIDLIGPRVLVSLGQWAYKAVCGAFGLATVPFRQAVDRADGFRVPGGPQFFPMYHCGARILNTHRPFPQQLRDWQRVATALKRA